jgi:hypothetical protein
MHPYLTKLGIRPAVQDFFAPYIRSNHAGDLLFDYGDEAEHFGFAFHRVPVSANFWMAGCSGLNLVSRVVICSSAMEAIAWFHFNGYAFSRPDNLLFLATGVQPNTEQFKSIHRMVPAMDYLLVFGNDLLSRIAELKVAAHLRKLPIAITLNGDILTINCRFKTYVIAANDFSLNCFEKHAGYRFKVKTSKPRDHDTYLQQLQAAALQY